MESSRINRIKIIFVFNCKSSNENPTRLKAEFQFVVTDIRGVVSWNFFEQLAVYITSDRDTIKMFQYVMHLYY